MSTGSIEYARAERVIDQPVDRVWAVAGRFGGVEQWIDGVTACSVEGEGIGAVRTVTRNGNSVREQLDRRDPALFEISYVILPPHPMPAANVRGTLTLSPEGERRTRAVWRSHATDFQMPPDALGARISAFYAASLEGLARLLSAA
jgi:mxaD protein